ncbi:MAG: phosphoglycerate mutase family protein [Pseudomonadota bacterium]
MRQNWPERLWLVRHGQSQGNVARDAADQAGAHEIDVELRDVDVPLSTLGEEQAEAAGRWFQRASAINSRRRPPTAAASANSTTGRRAARAGPT